MCIRDRFNTVPGALFLAFIDGCNAGAGGLNLQGGATNSLTKDKVEIDTRTESINEEK